MQLSIITINYNNPEGLERTIHSVLSQTKMPYEYIIVDGASTRGDVEIIKKYENSITKWVSERDGGIYPAINKGAKLATGDYCLFLNSGDTLYDDTVVSRINNLQLSEDFFEGIANASGQISYPPIKYTLGTFLYQRNPFHQASIIKRTMILERPYDESYKIAGDLAFNINNLVVHSCTYRPLNFVICNYEGGGRSATVEHSEEIKRIYSIFMPKIMEDYIDNRWLFQFPIKQILPFLHKIAKSVMLYKLKLFIKKMFNKPIGKSEYIELQDRVVGKI